jgi:hypothetical protein
MARPRGCPLRAIRAKVDPMRRGAPGDTVPIRGRATARPVVAVLVSIATLALLLGPGPVPAVAAPVTAAAACTGWTSHTVPPDTIRVLRTRGPADDTVQVVPFRGYVNVVMAAEWGPTNPREALRAGAVAVKEYAWYSAMRWRGKTGPDGQCYDVSDSTIDQLYSPEDRDPAATLIAAVDATWDVAVHRSGRVFSTHYLGGKDVACGSDADGTWLYQRSAMRCARDGKSADEILLLYYGPDAEIVRGGAGPIPSPSPTPSPSPIAAPAPSLALETGDATIAWGATVVLAATLAPTTDAMRVEARPLRIETSVDGQAWTVLGTVATDVTGLASFEYRPIANRWYRAVLDPAPDLPGATSDPARVTVRQRIALTPDRAGAASTLARDTTVAFTLVVRPARPDAPAGKVTVEAWRLVDGAWAREAGRTVVPDATGRATVRVTFDAAGSWYVRARAASTPTNANSAWTPLRRYAVR